jgi:hypothetical protein
MDDPQSKLVSEMVVKGLALAIEFMDKPAAHHETYGLKCCHIIQRVCLDGDDIGVFAGLKAANPGTAAKQISA